MLAIKAKYENGTVRWERKPPVSGSHDLIVVFADISTPDQAVNETERSVVSAKSAENKDDWTAFSLSNLESTYSDDEPEYSDTMLKSKNPEFKP